LRKAAKASNSAFVRAKSSGAELTSFPSLAGSSYECTRYELRVETGDIRPVLSLFRLKSRLDEFLGLLSSFVPIKADAKRTLNNGN
jgi:hypothetical protein